MNTIYILKINKGEKNKIVEFPPKKVKIKPSMTESNLSLKNKKRKKNIKKINRQNLLIIQVPEISIKFQ
jgi:hypothetical protein